MNASIRILNNSSFTYHPFIRRYIFLVTEKASLNKLQTTHTSFEYVSEAVLAIVRLTVRGRIFFMRCLYADLPNSTWLASAVHRNESYLWDLFHSAAILLWSYSSSLNTSLACRDYWMTLIWIPSPKLSVSIFVLSIVGVKMRRHLVGWCSYPVS
jgi:hypothetical protein